MREEADVMSCLGEGTEVTGKEPSGGGASSQLAAPHVDPGWAVVSTFQECEYV